MPEETVEEMLCQSKTHTRAGYGGGRGAANVRRKALPLLYALAHFQRHGDSPILFSAAEERLARLLAEFGPPRRSTPAYPWFMN